MKKILMTLAAVLCCAMTMPVLTSCSIEDNPASNPVQEDLAEATIMWYGCGGYNVDAAILQNFRTFYQAQTKNYDRVNVVAQYKTSYDPTVYKNYSYENSVKWAKNEIKNKTEKQLEEYNGAYYFFLCHPQAGASYRFALDPQKPLYKQFHEMEPYGQPNADCTNPDSLTNFINWATKNYPAKKYILMLADHGGGYLPDADVAEAASSPQRRGLIFDDGYKVNGQDKCFSAKSFARGVRSANVRMDGIVLYLCLMNNMEFMYDVKDVTDYIASSTYVMWAAGGAFGSLVDNLAEGKDTKTALSNFVDATVDSWDAAFYNPENPEDPAYYDLTLTETKRLDDLAPVLKEFTDRLVNTYQNGTAEQRAAIDECTRNAVKVNNTEPFYDMAKYMKSLFTVLPEVYDQDFYNRAKTTFNACIAHQRYAKYLTNHNYQVDYSMMLAVKGNYVRYGYTSDEYGRDKDLSIALAYFTDGTTKTYKYVGGSGDDSSDGSLAHYELLNSGTWGSTFADTYQMTTFDKLVGWSRWLLLNQAAPPAWSPSSFFFKLPLDDMSEIPVV